MDRGSDDSIKFKLFLEEFTAKHNGPVTSDDPLPFRLVTYRLTPDEVEGECIEWVMEYLFGQNHCPPAYAAAIAKATVDAVQSSDISSYEDERDEDEGKLIEANGFARFVFSKVHRICEEWNTSMPSITVGPGIHQVSLHAVRNTRRKMEDKHVVLQDINAMFRSRLKEPDDKPRSFYAVYDGHGGVDASYYAAAHLHLHTVSQPDFIESPTNALKKAFNETDEAFIQKAGREGLRSGSTGVAVVIEPDTIHLAWLGDSQAVLMRDCKPVIIMDPHKPDREDEKKRIEELGGCVVWFGAWRVNGSLAVSRSIGDPDYKPYVCSDADTAILPLDGSEECIIIACDGLWDVITPEGACTAIQEFIKSGADLSGVAPELVSMAKDAGSNDNITVMVVFLNPLRATKNAGSNSKKEELVVSGDGDQEKDSGNIVKEAITRDDNQSANTPAVSGETSDLSEGLQNMVVQNAVEANSNNNNINRNSGRKDSKSVLNMSKDDKDLVIKNGVNVIKKSSNQKARKSSIGHHTAGVYVEKNGQSPELISDYSKTNSKSQARRRSSLKKGTVGVSPIRRTSSTPAVHQRKSSFNNGTVEDVIIVDLGVDSKAEKPNRSNKSSPVQHKSMPISIKPKSLTRTRSLPRDPKLAAIMKNKLAAASSQSSPTKSDIPR
ncbi:protein phosphatase 1E-like [Lytechinus pictus]|uniref:protein phosphatase 1E-like n=1 Tax=Lytechinus pictus TaxID=7653 RepID=UPI0030B9BE5E